MTDEFIVVAQPIGECCGGRNPDMTIESRFDFTNIQVTPEDDESVFCAATNGVAMSIIRQDGHLSKTRLLPDKLVDRELPFRDHLKIAWDDHWISTVIHNGFPADGFPVESMREPDRPFPPVDVKTPPATENHAVVRLDAGVLLTLAKSFGTDGQINLMIHKENQGEPILVYGEYGIGVMMPLTDTANAKECYNSIREDFLAARAKQETKP